MSDPPGNSPSKYHNLFSHKTLHIGNTEVIISILSMWEDDRIERLEKNQWKYLWCNVIFQVIDDAKDLAHSIRTINMHIERCFDSIYQYHLLRYKDLKLIKAAKKGLINDYSHKMISSISRLQDNSSEVVESNIQLNSRGMYS